MCLLSYWPDLPTLISLKLAPTPNVVGLLLYAPLCVTPLWSGEEWDVPYPPTMSLHSALNYCHIIMLLNHLVSCYNLIHA